jgi:hypothetical protein
MNSSLRTFSLIAGALVCAACSETGATDPRLDVSAPRVSSVPPITVMTQNMYVGADVDAVIAALASPDPNDDLAALQTAIGTLNATNYPARAALLCEMLGSQRPLVLGLQEVSQIHIDLRALGLPVKIDQDFLNILLADIAARHLPYVLAAKVRDTQAAPFPGISLVDWDAVLIDASRVTNVHDVMTRQYAANGTVAPGVDIRRGFVLFRANVDGRPFTIASTHLESGDDPQIGQLRAAQAFELAGVLGNMSPVILTGDMNDVPGSPMYQVFSGAGLVDTWAALRPNDPGVTSCHLPDLSDVVPIFDQRIDYIWTRGVAQSSGLLGTVNLIGNLPQQRVSGPFGKIWASDHAGVVEQFTLSGGAAHAD